MFVFGYLYNSVEMVASFGVELDGNEAFEISYRYAHIQCRGVYRVSDVLSILISNG